MSFSLLKRIFVAILGISVVCGLALAFSIAKDVQQLNRQGDAAIFEQLIENIYVGKGAVSNVFANTQNFIDKGYVFSSTGGLIGKDLSPPSSDERSMMKFHAYFILFLVAPFLSFVQSSLLLTITQSLCFFCLVFAVAVMALRETRSLWVAILMPTLVLVNSNWIGGLLGQFYPDRLFVFAGFLICWMAWKRSFSITFLIVAIFTASINERAALIAGIAIMGCAMSRHEVNLMRYKSWPWPMIGVGVAMLAYAYLEKTYVLENLYYTGSYFPGSLRELGGRLSNPDFQSNIGVFFANNGALFLLAIAVPRLALLSLLIMMPNVIGSIGGAEKIGWLTHYHSYYFPILVFAATAGASRMYLAWRYRLALQISSINIRVFIAISIGATAFLLHKVVFRYDGSLPFRHAIASAVGNFSDWRHGRPTGYAIRNDAKSLFLYGQQVLTTEVGMALLHDHVRIGVFPVSIEDADALFIPCDWLQLGPSGYAYRPAEFGDWLLRKGFNVSGSSMLKAISYCSVHRYQPKMQIQR